MVPSQRRPHAPRCNSYAAVGSFKHSDRAGRNTFRISRVNGRKLAPGKYSLDLTPTANGQTGKTVLATFTVA